MSNYTRNTLSGDLAPVNAELEKVQTAIADKFDRAPAVGQANQLTATLDANSQRLINLPIPVNSNDAARLKDLEAISATGLPDQTGNAGKFVKTDGVAATWEPVTSVDTGSVPLTRTVNTKELSADVVINAVDVPYDNTASGLTATNTNTAIDELAASGLTLSQPTNVSPANGITEVALPATLTSSTATGTDLHIQSIWTVYSDAGATTEVYNSGAISDIVSHIVPDGILAGDTQYWWRVQYIGVSSFSPVSALTNFTSDVAFASLFATTLYTGNGTTQGIVSGLDFTTEGLVWNKDRDAINRHYLTDTVRGNTKNLRSDSTAAEATAVNTLTSFNTDGFSLGVANDINGNGRNFVAWQFIKKQGFFDIVQYTATGVGGQVVPHTLGHEVGVLIFKSSAVSSDWYVQHKDIPATQFLALNTTTASTTSAGAFNNTAMTSTEFTVGGFLNAGSAIAYLFAHNPSKGIFCGSYTGNGSTDTPVITGFPVGWVMIKNVSAANDWVVMDVQRQSSISIGSPLEANTTAAEVNSTDYATIFESNGFTITGVGGAVNNSGQTYIFMAIANPDA